jgi:hypothetical protein
VRAETVTASVNCFPPVGENSMSVDRLRPEINLLAAFSLTIAGALAIGLSLALAIIFVVR